MLEHTKTLPTDKTELHLIIPASKHREVLAYIRSLGGDIIESNDSENIQDIPFDSKHWTESFNALEGENNLPGLMLTEARKRMNFKKIELSSKTGIPQTKLAQMEKGKREISKQNAKKLAEVLGVGYRVFL